MPRTFDITPLRSLVAVATTGGVHRAAQSLVVSQSTVSQHLRRLEREAGVPLVTRDGRGVAFTDHGERLLSHARAILAAHDEATRAFDQQHRSVVIGGAQNSAAVVLPAIMRALGERLEGEEVRFHLDRNSTVRDMLDRGEIDIAVTSRIAPELGPRSDGFRLRWLWSADPDRTPPAEAVPLVVFSPPCTLRQPSFDAWSGHGRPWQVSVEVNDLASGLEAVRNGVGTMLTPVVDRLPDGTHTLAGSPAVPAVQLVVVHTDRTRPDLIRATAEILAEHVGSDRVEVQHHDLLPAVPYDRPRPGHRSF